MCFVWIWEQAAITSLYSINWLVFITKKSLRPACYAKYCVLHTDQYLKQLASRTDRYIYRAACRMNSSTSVNCTLRSLLMCCTRRDGPLWTYILLFTSDGAFVFLLRFCVWFIVIKQHKHTRSCVSLYQFGKAQVKVRAFTLPYSFAATNQPATSCGRTDILLGSATSVFGVGKHVLRLVRLLWWKWNRDWRFLEGKWGTFSG
jgi:hypothetical protein